MKSLYLNSDQDQCFFDATYFWDIMKKCGSSVEILKFDLTSSEDSSPLFDLSALTKLRRLNMRVPLSNANALLWIKKAFYNIPTENSLQDIFLGLISPEEESEYYCGNVPEVHDIFSQRKAFSKIYISIEVYNCDSSTEERVWTEMADQWESPKSNIELGFSYDDGYDLFLEFSSGSQED
ncbi:hypothetical protein BDQ17DRAFT_1355823 [Cyathus striatus]|nr:hypothetical protein BDQ17DRAFT_1355823 [Cyathus striatus]